MNFAYLFLKKIIKDGCNAILLMLLLSCKELYVNVSSLRLRQGIPPYFNHGDDITEIITSLF